MRRRGPVVLLCILVAAAAALVYSLNAQKKYTATASLLFNNTPLSQQIAGLQAVPSSNGQSQQDTNTQLLKLGDLASKTASRVGRGLTAAGVSNSLTISPQGDTTVVTVASTSSSPALSAKIANVYAGIFVSEQQNTNQRYYQDALATVERQISTLTPAQAKGPQGLALQERAQSLATLAQLRTDTVSLAQSASVPTEASSPSVKKDVGLAIVAGLLLGLAFSFGLERLDQRIREPEELEATYELPLLGAVPTNSGLRRGRGGSKPAVDDAVMDTFQFIRARLRYFNVDRELTVLAVVSVEPGDGKTTVAHWLANAAASAGSRTLLIEADLRRPTMADEVGLNPGPGLADVLIGASGLDEAIQAAELVSAGSGRDAMRTLGVLVAGALPPNPPEMLESNAMTQVLDRARAEYDFVVVDTPPLGAVSDALPLLTRVDGVAIVAALGRNRRDGAERLKATLSSVRAPVLGVIANRVKARSAQQYGYGYRLNDEEAAKRSPGMSTTNGSAPADTIVVHAKPLPTGHFDGPETAPKPDELPRPVVRTRRIDSEGDAPASHALDVPVPAGAAAAEPAASWPNGALSSDGRGLGNGRPMATGSANGGRWQRLAASISRLLGSSEESRGD